MFTLRRAPLADIIPIAGQMVTSRLGSAVQSHHLHVVVSATVQVSAFAAASIRNRGSILAAFDSMKLLENGSPRWEFDARAMRFYSETFAQSPLTATRLASTAIATYNVIEHFLIPFAHPMSLVPRETAYLERDSRATLEFGAQLSASAGTKLFDTTGGAVITLTNVKIQISHYSDPFEAKRPVFIPLVRQTTEPVNGANTRLPAFLKNTNYIRSLLISQDTSGVGEVSDIINGVALRGETRDIIGPDPIPWANLVRQSEFEYGGAVGPTQLVYLLLNFQQYGRLNEVLNPQQDVNLRFIFDAQPSVVAGAVSSFIRITSFELEHNSTLTDVNGNPLVSTPTFQV